MNSLNLKENIYSYLKNFEYMLFVVLTAILNFFHFLTHYSISIDDLNSARYYSGEMFAQGRFTSTVLHYIFNLVDVSPTFLDFVGIIFLVLSAILFNILFDKIVPKISLFSKIVFSVLLITSPVHLELMIFKSCTLIIGCGFSLIALSLIFVQDYIETKNKSRIVVSTLLLIICVSWYESLLTVYFSAVFSILILKTIYSDKKYNLKEILREGIVYAIPFVASVVIEYIFQLIIMTVFSIENSNYSRNSIQLYNDKGIIISEYIFKYLWKGFFHFPIILYNFSLLIGVLICPYLVKQKKNKNFFFLFLCFSSSLFILCLFMDEAPRYRMAQVIPYIIAFVFYLVSLIFLNDKLKGKWKKILFKLVCVYVVFLQISNFNYWSNLEWLRHIEETNVVNQVAQHLYDNCDVSKPVVFVGEYQLSDYLIKKSHASATQLMGEDCIFKKSDNILESVISWGVWAFNTEKEINTELLNFFYYNGHNFKQGTFEMYKEANTEKDNIPEWPNPGSIIEKENYILVNF